jgi:hypothetical protein
MVAVH